MTKKVLGKITSSQFGMVPDYPFLFGLQLQFALAEGCGIGCGGKYTVNVSPECQWLRHGEREQRITQIIDFLYQVLTDAKVHYVAELNNKPVEVEIENNTFVGFRILTEVL